MYAAKYDLYETEIRDILIEGLANDEVTTYTLSCWSDPGSCSPTPSSCLEPFFYFYSFSQVLLVTLLYPLPAGPARNPVVPTPPGPDWNPPSHSTLVSQLGTPSQLPPLCSGGPARRSGAHFPPPLWCPGSVLP